MERHDTDFVSLGFGLLFALTGTVFLLRDIPGIPTIDLRWIGPSVILLAGLWLLVTTGLFTPRRDEAEDA